MNGAVIAALISGAASIIVTIVTVISTNSRTRAEIKTQLALQDERQKTLAEKVDDLAADVRAHNKFGERISVFEEKLKSIDQRLEAVERRDAI